LSRDPIREEGGINLYSFVFNTPVIFWDYLGLEKKWEFEIVAPDNWTDENIEYVPWFVTSAVKVYKNGDPKCPCKHIDVTWKRYLTYDRVGYKRRKETEYERMWAYKVIQQLGMAAGVGVGAAVGAGITSAFSFATSGAAAVGAKAIVGGSATLGGAISHELFDNGWKETGYVVYTQTTQKETVATGLKVFGSEETKFTSESCCWSP
jgi:hypothetical protein